ncbi:hypothetical protein GR925_30840 [Streptomyces sp. HUCO-GS316]|uniref:hypothetical protein n=1 Tax=Streptomyces sp. HUCO-GS316 TaxID=2692198 RepID=UPI00136BECFC|nr:hypothetical protein [Streptomyces sp. HUCO-GS316]MXM67716.1 hypothetical protein [Streptomyces sp. HUCO-GS316]
MRRHTPRTAVALCSAALLGAAVSTACAAPPTAQAVRQQPRPPVLVDCFWHPKVRPADFMLACGDGNSRLTSLQWTKWNAHSATARGLNLVNDCKPYCAAGRFHTYRVDVRLDHPRPWKKHPQLERYTRISLTYPDGRPESFTRVMTYPLWD